MIYSTHNVLRTLCSNQEGTAGTSMARRSLGQEVDKGSDL